MGISEFRARRCASGHRSPEIGPAHGEAGARNPSATGGTKWQQAEAVKF